jgi:hypothetical protein
MNNDIRAKIDAVLSRVLPFWVEEEEDRKEAHADLLDRLVAALAPAPDECVSLGRIKNDEEVEPGTLVRAPKGKVVYEVLETERTAFALHGRLRDTRTGKSVGWSYLDSCERVENREVSE